MGSHRTSDAMDFESLLRCDPKEAVEQFYIRARRSLSNCPPPPMRGMASDEFESLFHDIVVHCLKDDLRRLRMYRNHGKGLEAWVYVVAYHYALDHPQESVPDPSEQRPAEIDNPPQYATDLVDIVCREILKLSAKCQLLLRFVAHDYSPREIQMVLGLTKRANLDIASAISWCRKNLRKRLKRRGLSDSDMVDG